MLWHLRIDPAPGQDDRDGPRLADEADRAGPPRPLVGARPAGS